METATTMNRKTAPEGSGSATESNRSGSAAGSEGSENGTASERSRKNTASANSGSVTASGKIGTRQIAFSAIAIALATVIATFLKLDGPFWVNGGSITLFSMLVIILPGYWYGPFVGLVAAFAHGILQFITNPYAIHPLQVLLDYPLAFGALGLAGFFYKKKNGLLIGYFVGILGRLFFHCVSGVIFYTEYIGDAGTDLAAIVAGIVYNMSYIIPEALISVILLALPPVSKAMKQIRRLATGSGE